MHRLSKLYSCALAATIASLGACAPTHDVRQDLDPAGTYFIEWRAADDATAASAARAIEAITDVRDLAALEAEGLVEVGRVLPLGRDDRALPADDLAVPTAASGPYYCPGYPMLRTLSGNTSITMSMSGNSGSYDVRYTPACASYPCTRTVTSTAASRQQVVTSFFWRTPTTWFNYWTMQAASTSGGWSVGLYSGSSSVSYQLLSCSLGGLYSTTVTHRFQ